MEMINHCTSEGKPTTSSQVFNRATNRAICFRASKGTWAHLKKLGLGRGRNPLFPSGHPWAHLGLAMAKAGWNSRWIHMDTGVIAPVGSMDRSAGQRAAFSRAPFCKEEGHTHQQQESVTTFRHSPSRRQLSMGQEAENWNQSNQWLC